MSVAFALLLMAGATADPGIPLVADDEGAFEYRDDFATPRFLRDAFLDNLGAEQWAPGSITNTGPNRNRTLTYRFYADRVIEAIEVRVAQRANGRHLGGRNTLYLSNNGLDWTAVADSQDMEADANGWQGGDLVLASEEAGLFAGGAEVWVRLVLDNFCGLETNPSNVVSSLAVRVALGPTCVPGTDPDAAARSAWGRQRRAAGWRAVTLDHADPLEARPPHYYEDADGWLQPPGARGLPNAPEGFPICRIYRDGERAALALGLFVATRDGAEPAMVRITVRSNAETHRELSVSWDGRCVSTFDAASYFEQDRDFFVTVPGPHTADTHELRIAGLDTGHSALIRRVEVAGEAVEGWAEKPPLPQGSALELVSSYYIPDPPPPPASQAVEGRQKVLGLSFTALQRLYEEHADFGAVVLVFRNPWQKPLRIGNTLLLNGRPIEDAYVDFVESPWDARGVVWYRVHPRTLKPGQSGQAYFRFRRRPEGDYADVTFSTEHGHTPIYGAPYVDPGVIVDYVTTGPDCKTLYIYARRTRGAAGPALEAVTLDGHRHHSATLYGADFPGGVALVVTRLRQPLKQGAYHAAGVVTQDGAHIAAQFRVLPFLFPRSSIHVPPDVAQATHMNLLTWRMHDEATCETYDLPTTCMHSDVLRMHPRVALIFAPDEPDAKDNRGGGYDKGLGWHARVLEQSGWQDLVARHTPPVASWMNINGTVRPLNWCVYGRFGDVNGFDPYPVSYYGADHAYVRESLAYARRCCAPTRMYAILEAYGWGEGQGVPSGARPPIPAEYRQNLVQAIGAGMKGLTSWVHSAAGAGWVRNDAFGQEIAKTNALLDHIDDLLLIGTPIDLATTDAGQVPTGIVGKEHWPKERVWAGAVLCGPDALVVAVANHIPASKPGPPAIEPARDVTVTVSLPDFIPAAAAYEATEEGLSGFPCILENGEVLLHLDVIESGRVFVLRRDPT